MNTAPLVSIVTPSFNQGRFLGDTLESVRRQDYPAIEHLVVDGGSSDDSVAIIRRQADRLAWWVSEKDAGQTDALCKGLRHATGRYFMWLCSDDMLEPSMVSIAVDHLERHPGVACVYGDRLRMDAKGNIYSLQRHPEFRPWMLRWWYTLPQETALIRRDALDAAGGLDASLHMAMDFDLWCRLSRRYHIEHIPAFLGRFRAHADNKSTHFAAQLAGAEGGPYFNEYLTVYRRHFGAANWRRRMALSRRLWPLLIAADARSAAYRAKRKRALALMSA